VKSEYEQSNPVGWAEVGRSRSSKNKSRNTFIRFERFEAVGEANATTALLLEKAKA
jgi:hypothetical protein